DRQLQSAQRSIEHELARVVVSDRVVPVEDRDRWSRRLIAWRAGAVARRERRERRGGRVREMIAGIRARHGDREDDRDADDPEASRIPHEGPTWQTTPGSTKNA